MKLLRAVSVGALASAAYAVSPMEVREQEFVDSVSGDRFMIIGVDYQPGGQAEYGKGSDPLSQPEACLRDAALMQSLGINCIRCYNVDPSLNHDQCASIFNSIGIYMIIDVNSPLGGESLDRSNPSSSYNEGYLTHVFSNIEAFKNYPNTLGFFAGNEVMNDVGTAQDNPPYIRAVQRDMKNYIANHANRTIPVGYSAADVDEILQDTWNYMQCQIDGSDNSRSDFFGLNDYSWCGSGSSYTISGYDRKVAMFSSSSIPVFFSEYGCNKPAPRVFDEVLSLYGPNMTVMSGGLIYEWTQEPDLFGLVSVNSNNSANILPDYNVLQEQYNKLNTTLILARNETATNLQAPQCDADLITSGSFSTDFDIPGPPDGVQQLINNGISNAPAGSIVSVTQTSVQVEVFQTNGARIEDLKITSVASANLPGDHTLATASTSGSPSTTEEASSATSTGAAHVRKMKWEAVGGGAVAAVVGAAAMVL